MYTPRKPRPWGALALSLALAAPIAACGGDDDGDSGTTATSNGTSNNTTDTSNGTTGTSNGTTGTSNGTTGTSNGTTGTSNGTTGTSNGTTATSNGTTGGMPDAYAYGVCEKPTPSGELAPGVYEISDTCWEVNLLATAQGACPGIVVTDYTSEASGSLIVLGDAYIQSTDLDITFGAWVPQDCVDTLADGDCGTLPGLISATNTAISGTCAPDPMFGGCQCEGDASFPTDNFGYLDQDGAGAITQRVLGEDGVDEIELISSFDGSSATLAPAGDEGDDNWALDLDYIEAESCLLYCAAFMGACDGVAGVEGYNNFDACMSTCNGFASDDADPPVTGGDSIECRLYHVQAAMDPSDSGNLALHCPHAALDGGGVCTGVAETLCDTYCDTMGDNCSGDNDPFTDRDDCMSACALYADDGMDGDQTGDTVQCRIFQASAAIDGASTYCPYAAPDGGNVCVDEVLPTLCETYCEVIGENCSGDNAVFESDMACMEACALYADDGMDGDEGGDTVQCRIYHAGVASENAALHCPHAGPDGAAVCVDAEVTVVPGDLAITEIMKNPSNELDASGEWFEIINLTDAALDISGLEFADDENDSFILASDEPVMLGAGEYYVLGNSDEEYVDYVYEGMALANGSDEVLIRNQNNDLIDRVAYTDAAFPDTANTALQFGGNYDIAADDNGDGANWCDAVSAISDTNTDLGTPGEANDICELPPEPIDVTIEQVRNPDANGHPDEDVPVNISGAVVIAISGPHMYIQDPAGGEWSGLYVSIDGVNVDDISIGSLVDLTGNYIEDDIGGREMGTLSTIELMEISVTGSGDVPAPTLVDDPGILSDPVTAEPWESTLVQVDGVSVIEVTVRFGEFEVLGDEDGDGSVLVDDLLFTYEVPAVDDIFVSIVGPLNYSFGAYKIVPRDTDDLVPGEVIMGYTEQEVQNVFNMNCNGCHIGGSTFGGLSLDDFTVTAINVSSGDGNPVLDYIEPGDADASYLVQKIQGTQGDVGGRGGRMPQGGVLSDADIEGIRGYVNGLAP